MDPDATLANIRRLLDGDDPDALADAVAALDGWLTGGGFLPAAWSRSPRSGLALDVEIPGEDDGDRPMRVTVSDEAGARNLATYLAARREISRVREGGR